MSEDQDRTEVGYEGTSAFEQGTAIVLETKKEGKPIIGEVLAISTAGIHILETHRFEEVRVSAEMDWEDWEEETDSLTEKDLRKELRGLGVKARYVKHMVHSELKWLLKEELTETLDEGTHIELVQLSRPIEKFVFIRNCFGMSNLQDIVIEQDIRGFRDNVKDASDLAEEENDE